MSQIVQAFRCWEDKAHGAAPRVQAALRAHSSLGLRLYVVRSSRRAQGQCLSSHTPGRAQGACLPGRNFQVRTEPRERGLRSLMPRWPGRGLVPVTLYVDGVLSDLGIALGRVWGLRVLCRTQQLHLVPLASSCPACVSTRTCYCF